MWLDHTGETLQSDPEINGRGRPGVPRGELEGFRGILVPMYLHLDTGFGEITSTKLTRKSTKYINDTARPVH